MAGSEAGELEPIRFEECLKCFKDTTDREPQILPCLHGFCKECIEYHSAGEDTEVSCPTCQSAWPAETVNENWFINYKKSTSEDKAEKTKCSSCDENVTATSYCTDCADTLCADCVAAHQRVKLTKDHKIIDNPDEGSDSRPTCFEHSDKASDSFCTQCNRFVCPVCVESEHKDHEQTEVESAFSCVKTSLSQQIINLQQMQEHSSKQLEELKSSLKDVSNIENKFRDDLKDFTIRIGKLLRETASCLMTSVGTVCKLQRKDIIKCSEELELVLDETSHLTRFLQSAVEHGSEKALLAASGIMHDRCSEAKERDSDAKAGATEAIAPLQLEFSASAGLERLVCEMGFAVSGKQRLPPSQTGVDMFQILRQRTPTQVENLSDTQANGKAEDSNGIEDFKEAQGDATPPMEATDLDLKVLSGEVLMNDSHKDKYNFSKQHEDDDPYEDYCSVCHDGGDLLCCDGADCNRVYHLQCHVPALDTEPEGLWECTMCTHIDKVKDTESPNTPKKTLGITENEIKMAERMLLELYCHPNSQIFHLPVPRATHNYFKIISQPMDFSTIRQKLGTQSFNHYHTLDDFVLDLKLIFDNCIMFNGNDSSLGKAANTVRSKLHSLLESIVPRLLPLLSTDDQPPAKRARNE